MKALELVDKALNRGEEVVLIFLLTVMMLLAFTQVVLRNAFSSGILWGDILLRHIVLWLGFLGGALATSKQRHIHIDAFAHFMSPRVKSVIGVLTNLFGAAICVLLYLASVKFVRGEIEARTEMLDGIPSWYAEVIIPVGFGLHIIHFLIRSGMNAFEVLKKDGAA